MQGEASWTRRDYAGLAREGFMRNPVVHRAVQMIAQAAGAVPWILYEGAAEATGHPLLDLIERPNARQAGSTFLETLYGHLLIAGSAYAELVEAGGSLRELHLLRPDRTAVLTDAQGWPTALEHRVGTSRRVVPLGGAGGGGALLMSLFHPLDDHRGFPPLEAALTALDTHNAAGRWNKALLDNSARPSGALVYAPKEGGNLSVEQFDRLKAELEENFSGASRAGRPLLLEGGLDWKTMGLSPKDMDFIEAKNSASRDIALAFGVPPMLLGIPGDNTYANYLEANRAFYRLTVLPLVARTVREFSAWLGPLFGGGLRLWYDADQVEGLAAERDSLWARIAAADFLGDDEKREAVGYSPRGGLHGKAGYRPEQPRVPAGHPDGGQWAGGGAGEGSSASVTQVADDGDSRRYSVNLREEEAPAGIGHAIREHVRKTDAELIENMERKTYRGWWYDIVDAQEGTFESIEKANDLTNQVLRMNKVEVDSVASGAVTDAYLEERFGYVTGREAVRTEEHPEPYFRSTYSVGVYIRHDRRSKRGYYVVTAYPRNRTKDNNSKDNNKNE
jgi:HK97 family phage portal protein